MQLSVLFPLQLHSVSNLKPVIPSTVPDDFLETDDSGSDKPASSANGAAAAAPKKGAKRGRKPKEPKAPKAPKVPKGAQQAAAATVVTQPPPIGEKQALSSIHVYLGFPVSMYH